MGAPLPLLWSGWGQEDAAAVPVPPAGASGETAEPSSLVPGVQDATVSLVRNATLILSSAHAVFWFLSQPHCPEGRLVRGGRV